MLEHGGKLRFRPARPAALAATLAALFLPLALAAVPRASADPVKAGKTRFELSRVFFALLEEEGVQVSKLKQGEVNGRVIALPVTEGLIDLGTASGAITHGGGFKLESPEGVARVTDVTLDTAKHGLWAKLSGKRMRIASVKRYGYSRAGFGDQIEVEGLQLNARATGVLNRALRLHDVFRPGRAFASISSSFQPEWDSVTGGSMQFSLDPGTVANLKSLEVEPIRFEVAAGPGPFSYSAPVINGTIYPSLNAGGGGIEGGFEIAKPEAPGPVITVADLGLSLEANEVSCNFLVHTESGQLAPAPAGPIAALDLSGSTARVDPETRTVTIANARATLEASAANLIDETFAKGKAPAVAAGDPLGTFSLTLQGR